MAKEDGVSTGKFIYVIHDKEIRKYIIVAVQRGVSGFKIAATDPQRHIRDTFLSSTLNSVWFKDQWRAQRYIQRGGKT